MSEVKRAVATFADGSEVDLCAFRSVRVPEAAALDALDAPDTVTRARDLWSILRGGYCTRWHANAAMAHIRETLAEHHARIAQILLALHPDPSLALIDAALHHDAGEPEVGDVPSPVKRDNPELAAILDAIEARARRRLGVPEVREADRDWLKFADRLAAFLHVQHVNPRELDDLDWRRDRNWLRDEARRLGVSDQICGLL